MQPEQLTLPDFINNPTKPEEGSSISPSLEPDAPVSEPAQQVKDVNTNPYDKEFPSFAVSLMALASINHLGRKGIQALFHSLQGALDLIWKQDEAGIRSVLLDAKVPEAKSIAAEIRSDRERLIEVGYSKVDELLARNIHIVPQRELPHSLLHIPNGPCWLFVEGNPKVLHHQPAIAIVGTRTATQQGINAAKAIVKVLAPYPVAIVSGLADGIDAAAHRSSLQENLPNIAFLGHGIDHIFPAGTANIRQEIINSNGAVASEYLPTERYQKDYFVQRNRLQAALASIVIPVEANPKGGTAHTIRFAQKYGKKVIGIRWPGANGILKQLEDKKELIVNISTPAGRLKLDHLIQLEVIKTDKKPYPLLLVENYLQREVQSRHVTPANLLQLKLFIEEEIKKGASIKNDQSSDF